MKNKANVTKFLSKNKITRATLKSFIKKNQGNLLLSTINSFNGMTDGCDPCKDQSFRKTQNTDRNPEYTFGIDGVWCVGLREDLFTVYHNNGLIGVEVYNPCGFFRLAVKEELLVA